MPMQGPRTFDSALSVGQLPSQNLLQPRSACAGAQRFPILFLKHDNQSAPPPTIYSSRGLAQTRGL